VTVVDCDRLYPELDFDHGFQSLKIEYVVINYQDVNFVMASAGYFVKRSLFHDRRSTPVRRSTRGWMIC
jgi:hypothetical protein